MNISIMQIPYPFILSMDNIIKYYTIQNELSTHADNSNSPVIIANELLWELRKIINFYFAINNIWGTQYEI